MEAVEWSGAQHSTGQDSSTPAHPPHQHTAHPHNGGSVSSSPHRVREDKLGVSQLLLIPFICMK